MHNLIGFVEQERAGQASGWIAKLVQSDRPITIEIFDGDRLVGSQFCVVARPDLEQAGLPEAKGFIVNFGSRIISSLRIEASYGHDSFILPPLSNSTNKTSNLVLSAIAAELTHRNEYAASLWRSCLEQNPLSIEVWCGLARSAFNANQHEIVKPALEIAALQAARERNGPLGYVAQQALNINQTAVACVHLAHLSQNKQLSAGVALQYAEVLLDLGRIGDSEAQILDAERALGFEEKKETGNHFSESDRYRFLLNRIIYLNILISLKQGNPITAQNSIAKHVENDSNNQLDYNADWTFLKGKIAELRGDINTAKHWYQCALAKNAQSRKAAECLIGLIAASGDYFGALEIAKNSIENGTVSSTGVLQIMDIYQKTGDQISGSNFLSNAKRRFPDDVKIAIAFVKLSNSMRDIQSVFSEVDVWLKRCPNHIEFVSELVVGNSEAGNWLSAVKIAYDSGLFTSRNQAVDIILRIQNADRSAAASVVIPNMVIGLWRDAEMAYQMSEKLIKADRPNAAIEWAFALARSQLRGQLTDVHWVSMSRIAALTGRPKFAEAWLKIAMEQKLTLSTITAAVDCHVEKIRQSAACELQKLVDGADAPPVSWMLLIRSYAASKNWAKVEDEASRALEVFSDQSGFIVVLIEAAIIRNSVSEAIALAKIVRSDDKCEPKTQPNLLVIAYGNAIANRRMDLAERLINAAAAFVTQIVSLSINSVIVSRVFSFCARHPNHSASAISAVSNIAECGRLSTSMLKTLSSYFSARADSDNAIRYLSLAAAQEPGKVSYGIEIARLLIRQQRWAEARAVLTRYFNAHKNRSDLRMQMAVVLEAMGEEQKAESLLRLLVAEEPLAINRLRLLSEFLVRIDKIDHEIIKVKAHALQFQMHFESRLYLAVLQFSAGLLKDADECLSSFSDSITSALDVREFQVNLRYLRMDYAGAKALLNDVASQPYRTARDWRQLAALMKRVGSNNASSETLRRGVYQHPFDASLALSLADDLCETGGPNEAKIFAENAVNLDPFSARAYLALGCAARYSGDTFGARSAFMIAEFLQEEDPVVLSQRAELEENEGAFKLALDYFSRSITAARNRDREPGARTLWHSVTINMLLGNYGEAVRLHSEQCDLFDKAFAKGLNIWRGGDLAGRSLLVSMRGGPGDELRIATTCIPWLIESGASCCTMLCDPRLLKLLSRTFPEINFVATYSGHRQLRREKAAHNLFDVAWPLISMRTTEMSVSFAEASRHDLVCHSDALFHEVFFRPMSESGEDDGTERKTWHFRNRSLNADPSLRTIMRRKLDSMGLQLKVGLCWRGSYVSRYRARGFLSVSDILPILSTPDVTFVNLQVNTTPEEMMQLESYAFHTVSEVDLFDDFEGVSALITELDLVISLGVTMRDVAGSVGTPVWSFTVFSGASDVWRKASDGSDRWQPSIRHFDLLSFGSREAVVAAIAVELAELTSARASVSRGADKVDG